MVTYSLRGRGGSQDTRVQNGTPRPRTLILLGALLADAATLCPQAWKAHFLRDAPSLLLAG